ncbi:unnamed protein product [Ectocarpus sp. 6 AP-2014]
MHSSMEALRLTFKIWAAVHLFIFLAPQDKAWRRRGWLVLCRTRPNRVLLKAKHGGASPRSSTRNVRARDAGVWAKIRRWGDVPAGSRGGHYGANRDATAGGLGGLLVAVLGAREEGVFRSIVGYLLCISVQST